MDRHNESVIRGGNEQSPQTGHRVWYSNASTSDGVRTGTHHTSREGLEGGHPARWTTGATPDALMVALTAFTFGLRAQITALALNHRLPSIYGLPAGAVAGGLMSYGPDDTEYYRQAAVFVDKILKGAKPDDLPVEQAMRFDLVVNMKTAKALGITIPPTIMVQAARVIE